MLLVKKEEKKRNVPGEIFYVEGQVPGCGQDGSFGKLPVGVQ